MGLRAITGHVDNVIDIKRGQAVYLDPNKKYIRVIQRVALICLLLVRALSIDWK